MDEYAILMLVFGVLILLAGIYIYTGHNSHLLLWKGYNRHATKSYLRKVGSSTMIAALAPILSGFSAIFFEEESIIPFIILATFIVVFITSLILKNK